MVAYTTKTGRCRVRDAFRGVSLVGGGWFDYPSTRIDCLLLGALSGAPRQPTLVVSALPHLNNGALSRFTQFSLISTATHLSNIVASVQNFTNTKNQSFLENFAKTNIRGKRQGAKVRRTHQVHVGPGARPRRARSPMRSRAKRPSRAAAMSVLFFAANVLFLLWSPAVGAETSSKPACSSTTSSSSCPPFMEEMGVLGLCACRKAVLDANGTIFHQGFFKLDHHRTPLSFLR